MAVLAPASPPAGRGRRAPLGAASWGSGAGAAGAEPPGRGRRPGGAGPRALRGGRGLVVGGLTASSQRHRPWGGAGGPACLRSPARRMPAMSPARRLPRPTSTMVPTKARTICWQNADWLRCRTAATPSPEVIPPGVDDPAHQRPVVGRPCGRTTRSRARRRAGRTPAAWPAGRGAVDVPRRRRPGTGRAPAGSAPCSDSADRSPSAGVEVGRRGAPAPRWPAPSILFAERCRRPGRRRRLPATSKLTTWPQACTPASVRPGARQLDRVPEDLARGPPVRSPATVAPAGWAAKPRKRRPS